MGDPRPLNHEVKMKLIGFACAFAWADLEMHPKERARVLRLMERLEIESPEDRRKVVGWLKVPPVVDELDPNTIPRPHRELFVHECEEMIKADGVIRPEETDAMVLLKKILFGDRAAGTA